VLKALEIEGKLNSHYQVGEVDSLKYANTSPEHFYAQKA